MHSLMFLLPLLAAFAARLLVLEGFFDDEDDDDDVEPPECDFSVLIAAVVA